MAAFTEHPGVPKRPWYVTLALIGAFLFAIGAASEGCEGIRHYQGGETKLVADEIRDEATRTKVRVKGEALLDSLYKHKKTLYPLHIALFLVSAAMATFSVRVLFTKSFGRSLLVQLVGVQALLMIGLFFAERETRDVAFEYDKARLEAGFAASGRPAQGVDIAVKIVRTAAPVYLGFRTLMSLLIITALLDRRARLALDVPDPDESTSEFE